MLGSVTLPITPVLQLQLGYPLPNMSQVARTRPSTPWNIWHIVSDSLCHTGLFIHRGTQCLCDRAASHNVSSAGNKLKPSPAPRPLDEETGHKLSNIRFVHWKNVCYSFPGNKVTTLTLLPSHSHLPPPRNRKMVSFA